MKLEINAIERVSDNRYRLDLRASKRLLVYVVGVYEDPVPGLEAPNSLWRLLEDDRSSTKRLVEAVFRIHRNQDVIFPVEISEVLSWEKLKLIESGPPRASRSATWKLARSSLRWASKHLTLQRANTLFPIAFEHKLIDQAWEAFEGPAAQVELHGHSIRGYRQMFAPKSSAGRRVATQLDPLDALLLTGAVFELGEYLECARVPASEGIVHSFRFAPQSNGQIWDPSWSYDSFVRRSSELLGEREMGFVAESDISEFYHSIPVEALTHNIERIGVDARRTQAIHSLLSSFSSTGLPVGPSFSSLLAESILIASDEQLRSRGCSFVRFNDDYRIFCRTEVEAQGHLQALADALSHSGLTLQGAKTRIWDKDSFSARMEKQQNGWLRHLRATVAEHENPYGELVQSPFAPEDRELIESAKSLLLKAIDDSHVAWTQICRRAFGALPLEDRLAMLPQLLHELPRIWGLAPLISWSLRDFVRMGLDDMAPLARAVFEGLTPAENNGGDVPEYALAWILDALSRADWPGRSRLLSLADGLSEDSLVWRELLLALRGCEELYSVQFNTSDPWQLRAFLWTSGGFPDAGPQIRSTNGPVSTWYDLLDELIRAGRAE